MAVAYDAATSAHNGTAGAPQTTCTWSHTGASGAALVVAAVVGRSGTDTSGYTVTVTYNSVLMSSAVRQAPGSNTSFIEKFTLLAACDGAAHNVVITVSTAAEIVGGAKSYTGVGSFGTGVGSAPGIATNSGTLNVSSASDGMVDFTAAHGDSISGVGGTGTQRWLDNWQTDTSGSCGVGGSYPGAGTVACSATSGVSDHWTLVAVPLIAGSTDAASTRVAPLLGPGSTGPLGWQWRQIVGVTDLGGAPLNAIAEIVAATLAALNPTPSIGVQPGTATGTAAAQTAAASSSVTAGLGAATVASPTAIASIGVQPATATATGAALDPTISTTSNLNVPAPAATATGAAQTAIVSIAPNAGLGTVTGAALAPTESAKPNAQAAAATGAGAAPSVWDQVNAPTATATGTAQTATADIPGALNVNAGLTTATGVAQTPSLSEKVNTATATATGTAQVAVWSGPAARLATATGATPNPSLAIRVNAPVAAAILAALAVTRFVPFVVGSATSVLVSATGDSELRSDTADSVLSAPAASSTVIIES